jgi:peptide/nickel transport system permease protein
MYVSLFAGVIVSGLGVLVGSLAAIFRGKVEEVLMRITDVFLAIPGLVLALAISGTLGHTFFDLVIALSVGGWSHLARIVRGEVLTEMNKPYAEALRILGFGKARILFGHVLRNVSFFLASVIFLTLSFLVTFLASLEYIGFAIGSLSPELGALIAQAQPYIFQDPWLLIISAAFLIYIIVSFLLLGDEVRYFDPRKNV